MALGQYLFVLPLLPFVTGDSQIVLMYSSSLEEFWMWCAGVFFMMLDVFNEGYLSEFTCYNQLVIDM